MALLEKKMLIEAENAFKNFKYLLIKKIGEIYGELKGKDLVIWGTGRYGKTVAKYLVEAFGDEINIKAFCCSSGYEVKEKLINGLIVYPVDKAYVLFPNATFVIVSDFRNEILLQAKKDFNAMKTFSVDPSSSNYEKQLVYIDYDENDDDTIGFKFSWIYLFNYLKKSNILPEKLSECLDSLSDEKSKTIVINTVKLALTGDINFLEEIPVDGTEYFSSQYYEIYDDEVYADCGSYNGDSILNFIKYKNGRYKKIIAFEPDLLNFDELNKTVKTNNINRIELVNCALTDKSDKKVSFSSRHNMGAKILDYPENNTNSGQSVSTYTLDDFYNEGISFIKMDIEGYELRALKGARKTIVDFKPKLAICLYHKALDIFEITSYIKQLVPEYQVIIRHHYYGFYETVMYAWIPK